MARTTAPRGAAATTPLDLDALALAISTEGIDRHCAEVAHLAGAAVDAGLSPALIGALCDGDQPEMARQRAFARIAVVLERPAVPAPAAHRSAPRCTTPRQPIAAVA